MIRASSPSYLSKNPYSYCFRMRIPKDLQPTISKKELRYSLRTGNLSAAKAKARYLAGQFQLLFREMKLMNLTKEQINKLIIDYKDKLFKKYDKPVPYGQYDHNQDYNERQLDMSVQYQWIEAYGKWLKECLALGDYSGKFMKGETSLEDKVDDLLIKNGVKRFDINKNKPEYARLCQGVIGVELKGLERYEKKLDGDFSDDLEDLLKDPPKTQTQGKLETEQVSITLGELADAYANEKRQDWRPSTWNDWKTIRKTYFRFVNPTIKAHKITRRVFFEYREVLRSLPPRFMSTKKYEHMTDKDVKDMALPSEERVNPKTVNKHINFLHGMFKHAVNLEYIPSNPASDMQVPESKGKKQTVDKFSSEDLKLIFESPVLGEKYPYQFWIPVLALFTGARREELCNLYKEDIKQEKGIWYMDINMEKPDKFIKTYQTRKVPLHPFLLELGFLKFVEKFRQGERIWPQLKNSNQSKKYGHYFGRWFNEKLIQPLGIKPTKDEIKAGSLKKTFHSFRHTLITLGIRSGMDVLKVKGMVGHEEDGVTFDSYFKGFTVPEVYAEIVSKFDHGIDLSHLKNSKWVIRD